jgi:hypothetical protein
LIIVSLGIWLVLSLIPGDVIAELRVQASEAARLPRSRAAAIIIIAIWILAAAALGWVGFAYWARPHRGRSRCGYACAFRLLSFVKTHESGPRNPSRE